MKDDLPPPNRGIIWYRVMLWLMPTCIAGTTALGAIGLAEAIGLRLVLPILLWVALNFATTFALGVFEAHLRQPPPPHRVDCAANFTFIQLIFGIATFSLGFAFAALRGGF